MLVINFMQVIYNYTPETNRVSSVYSAAAVLYLQSVLHVTSFRPWNMFCTFYVSTSPQFVCSAQYGCCFWQFLNFVLSPVRCSGTVWVTLKLFQSPLLLPVSLLLSHSACAEFLLWGLCVLKYSRLLFYHISVSRNCNVCWHASSLFIITDYGVRFIVTNSSVGSHLLVPQYGNLTCITCVLLLLLVLLHVGASSRLEGLPWLPELLSEHIQITYSCLWPRQIHYRSANSSSLVAMETVLHSSIQFRILSQLTGSQSEANRNYVQFA